MATPDRLLYCCSLGGDSRPTVVLLFPRWQLQTESWAVSSTKPDGGDRPSAGRDDRVPGGGRCVVLLHEQLRSDHVCLCPRLWSAAAHHAAYRSCCSRTAREVNYSNRWLNVMILGFCFREWGQSGVLASEGWTRGMATLLHGNQELLMVRDKVGRPPVELGVNKSM